MSNFMFSLNATLPVFLVIVLGWFLMQKKMFNENFVDIINKFVFKVSLPVLLFKDIATTPIRDAFDPKFVIFCMIGTTIMFMGIWALTSIFMKDKSMVGAFTQASARGSAAVLGIAFVQNIYGQFRYDTADDCFCRTSVQYLFRHHSDVLRQQSGSLRQSGHHQTRLQKYPDQSDHSRHRRRCAFFSAEYRATASGIKNSDKCCPDSHADGTACCRCRF